MHRHWIFGLDLAPIRRFDFAILPDLRITQLVC